MIGALLRGDTRAAIHAAFVVWIVLTGVAVVPFVAAASSVQPMRFVIVQGASRLCSPLCPRWISAEGKIVSGTPALLQEVLRKAGSMRMPIIISSYGGDVEAALAMGRLIRASRLDVAVGRTTFISCAPEDKGCDAEKKGGYVGVALDGWGYCVSACPFVLSGGVRRLVGEWATVSVHQITTTYTTEKVTYKTVYKTINGKRTAVERKPVSRKVVSTRTSTKIDKTLRAKLEAHLNGMGVSLDILKYLQTTPPEKLLLLSKSEMLEMKLISGLESLATLEFPAACPAKPVAPGC